MKNYNIHNRSYSIYFFFLVFNSQFSSELIVSRHSTDPCYSTLLLSVFTSHQKPQVLYKIYSHHHPRMQMTIVSSPLLRFFFPYIHAAKNNGTVQVLSTHRDKKNYAN